jgi:hypothetical protein
VPRASVKPRRSNFVSTLPKYQAKRSVDFPAFLIVNCPRQDCPGTKADRPFLVAEQIWMKPQMLRVLRTGREYEIVGRSCPYCFKAAQVPKRSEIR